MSSGVALSWDASGDPRAPPVVLLHSLGADRSSWESLSVALRASHRVIRLDLRGHGSSPSPPGPYSIKELAEDVLGVADAAGLSQFHVCGISLGGLIAISLAARAAGRISTLVAANTASKIGTDAHWAERCRAVRAAGMHGIADAVIGRWFAPGFAEKQPETFADLRRVFAATDEEGYIGCCNAIATADLSAELSRIDVPALVIGSTMDASTPVENARALHDGIRGSRLVVFRDAGHLSNLDVPAAFDDAVKSFLLSFDSRH